MRSSEHESPSLEVRVFGHGIAAIQPIFLLLPHLIFLSMLSVPLWHISTTSQPQLNAQHHVAAHDAMHDIYYQFDDQWLLKPAERTSQSHGFSTFYACMLLFLSIPTASVAHDFVSKPMRRPMEHLRIWYRTQYMQPVDGGHNAPGLMDPIVTCLQVMVAGLFENVDPDPHSEDARHAPKKRCRVTHLPSSVRAKAKSLAPIPMQTPSRMSVRPGGRLVEEEFIHTPRKRCVQPPNYSPLCATRAGRVASPPQPLAYGPIPIILRASRFPSPLVPVPSDTSPSCKDLDEEPYDSRPWDKYEDAYTTASAGWDSPIHHTKPHHVFRSTGWQSVENVQHQISVHVSNRLIDEVSPDRIVH
ncbi:hypothetical protein FA95DRAFT_203977 [Auriscalpium vulgare]|uniref:Uncharacterized protein n=1 Tax=Auriscalpium vulgare TaxID=40419 RepID=A0ACB8S6G6_9AGAM|nr:hypothetical protein FA95DRAFT_203977 [Auriscalpium vulgare]